MSATTVDELQVLISANASQFQQEIKKVQAQMGEMNRSMKSSTSGMRGLSVAGVAMGTMIGTAMSKVAGILSSQLNPAISRLDTLNNFPRVMANLGVSSSLSEKSIAVLSEKLKGLPTTLDDAAMSVQRFTSANGSIGASTQMFLALNNAILAGGGSAEIQRTALEQLSQAYAKGKPDMMEWRSLMTAMPAQLKQIAQSMNYASSADLGEALREGKLSMNDFMAQIVKLNREGFGGFASFEEQARNSTGGVATSLANLRNAIVRAITDVMNIVGQANISGFFQSIANAINAVVPYVAAFVKVVMMAIGALRTLFGGGGKSSPQKATAEISDNLGSAGSNASGLADSAGGAGKKLGGAAKQAKKLAEQLAGFDEMNVLKTPEEPSGGGSGGSGGSGGGGGAGGGISGTLPDFGEIDTSGLDSVAKKAEEIANSIVKFFKDGFKWFFDGVNFEPLKKSLANVFPVLQKGFEVLQRHGEWILRDVFRPLAKWTIERTAPASINVLTSSMKFLISIGDGVMSIFRAIWRAVSPVIDIFSAVGSLIMNVVAGAFSVLSGVIDVIVGGFNLLLAVTQPVFDAISAVAGAIGDFITGIGQGIFDVMNAIGEFLSAIGGFLNATAGVVESSQNVEDQKKREQEATENLINAQKQEEKTKNALSNASLALMNAEDAQSRAQEKLNKFIEQGDTSSREYKRAKLELEVAQGRVKEAAEKETEAQNKHKEAQDGVAKSSEDLQKTKEEETKKNQENTTKILSSIGKMIDGWNNLCDTVDRICNSIVGFFRDSWNGITDVFNGIGSWFTDRWNDVKNAFSTAWNTFSKIGQNIWDGLKNGIGNLARKVGKMFEDAVNGVKNFLGIRSPSRLFRSYGGFVGEGFALGIEDEQNSITKTLQNMTAGFKPEIPPFELAKMPKLSNELPDISKISGSFEQKIEASISDRIEKLNEKPINLTVNVGNEKMLEQLIDGINSRSFMNNTSVIDF